jgi:HD-GYP domain-containing protein (c-di-GMP phosphodiesterase class II)
MNFMTPADNEQNQQINDLLEFERVLWAFLGSLAEAIETSWLHGDESGTQRMTELAVLIAKKMGLSTNQVKSVRLGAILHDIGNLHIPQDILSSKEPLSEEQFDVVKRHSEIGFSLLRRASIGWPIAEMIHQHHERLDGSGYPKGLSGDDIIIEARILAVADVVSTMLADRPYRAKLDIRSALGEIELSRGKLYDADIVDICVDLFRTEQVRWE